MPSGGTIRTLTANACRFHSKDRTPQLKLRSTKGPSTRFLYEVQKGFLKLPSPCTFAREPESLVTSCPCLLCTTSLAQLPRWSCVLSSRIGCVWVTFRVLPRWSWRWGWRGDLRGVRPQKGLHPILASWIDDFMAAVREEQLACHTCVLRMELL